MEFLQGIFSRIKSWFTGIWEKTEKRDRTRFVVISGVAVVLLISAIVVLNNARYEDLVSFSSSMELNTATSILRENGISSRTSGNTIQVDRGDYNAAHAALVMRSEINLEADWSIYAQSMGLTSTAADRRELSKVQTESRLKQIFESSPVVSHAGVIINLPEIGRGIFVGEQEPKTASVVLHLNTPIDDDQIKQVEDFVAFSAGIDPEFVTISDGNLRPLNRRTSSGASTTAHQHYALKLEIEENYERAAMRMLGPLFGPGNVNVSVDVKLDWDETVTESMLYYPVVDDEGIPRSIQTVNEYARGSNLQGGFPGTDENGLGMDFAEYPELLDQFMSEWRRDSETINNEISHVHQRIINEQGRISERTVSVNINTDNLMDTDQNTMAVRQLIGATVGLLPHEWNDNVIVHYMPLLGLRMADEMQNALAEEERRQQMFDLIQTLVLYGIIGICLILLIWRTFAFLKPQVIEIPAEMMAGDADEYATLLESAATASELEITKTPTRERIEEFVDNHPEAVANMLRNWLSEEEENRW